MNIQKKIKKKQYSVLGILVLFFLLSLSQVFSYDTNKILFCLDFESNTSDYNGVNNFTNSGIDFVNAGHIGNSGNCTSSESDYATADKLNLLAQESNFSIAGWIYHKTEVNWNTIYSELDDNNGNRGTALFYRTSDDKMSFMQRETATCNDNTCNLISNETTSTGQWYFMAGTHDSNDAGKLYIDGSQRNSGTNPVIAPDNVNAQICKASFGALYSNIMVDTLIGYNETFNSSDIDYLYNNGNGRNCSEIMNIDSGPTPDTTNPVLGNIVQSPDNFTIETIYDVTNVTINITDNINLNDSSVKLNLTLNNSLIYINGTLQPTNSLVDYTSKTGNEFLFELDEHNLVPASYPLNPDIENQFHENTTLTSLNQWAKMQFFNISSNVRQAFYEIADENISGGCLPQYYYCNSSYTTGNPTSSDECVLFFEGNNSQGSYHSHEQVTHQIIPMGIDITTGTLNGLPVTPEIFILKRGTACAERLYYVTNVSRTSQSQTTGNNGQTWSDLSGTFNAHIHQIGENSSFYYEICAQDNSSNKACKTSNTDYIDFPTLRPNAISFYVPIATTYNGTITINHTESFSASGQTIQTYTYYYINSNGDITLIGENNHPDTERTLNTENLANGNYTVRVITKDSLNLTTVTDSEVFTVNNPLGLDTQLLTSIDTTLDNIYEVINLIPIVSLYAIFMFLGFLLVRWKQTTAGLILLANTLGMDFFFIQKLYNDFVSGNVASGYTGLMLQIFGVTLIFWIFFKIYAILSLKVTSKQFS